MAHPTKVERFDAALKVVEQQVRDASLWIEAETAPEGYLQQELRRLHRALEGDEPPLFETPDEPARPSFMDPE